MMGFMHPLATYVNLHHYTNQYSHLPGTQSYSVRYMCIVMSLLWAGPEECGWGCQAVLPPDPHATPKAPGLQVPRTGICQGGNNGV